MTNASSTILALISARVVLTLMPRGDCVA